ncbi:flagellar motor protein MotB [Planctomycetota bacterium]
MRPKRQQPDDSGPNVPAYIVTFSDMVTLLLTFFVMLLSMSKVRDPDLFYITRDAFVQHIHNVGLGMLFGRTKVSSLDKHKTKFFISDTNQAKVTRTIDSKEEDKRRLFKKVTESMKVRKSQIVAKKTNFVLTDINFSPGNSRLNDSAKSFLRQFAMGLQANESSKGLRLYILGLDRNEKDEKQQWMLSAIRAKVVADFLRDALPLHLNWPIYSWGAGPGGDWVGQETAISEKSQIMIAILRNSE